MKALVQMLTNDIGVQFNATTDADADGLFWWFAWGYAVEQSLIEFDTEEGCNEHWINWIENPGSGWRCDGAPIVVHVPGKQGHERWHAWAERAMVAMETLVRLHQSKDTSVR